MRLSTLFVVFSVIYSMSVYSQNDFTTFQDAQGRFQLTAPANWEPMDLNDVAEIEIGNAGDELYLVLISDLKEDMYGWNLDKHSRITLTHILRSLAFPEVIGPEEVQVNGEPALKYIIHGATEGLKISYIHVTTETEEHFDQLLAWTLKSRFDDNAPLLMEVISSFQPAEKAFKVITQ